MTESKQASQHRQRHSHHREQLYHGRNGKPEWILRMTRGTRAEASATCFAYLATHGGEYASARVALGGPTENDDEEDDLGGEHRRIVRDPA